jgi:hypothetical protein
VKTKVKEVYVFVDGYCGKVEEVMAGDIYGVGLSFEIDLTLLRF